MEHEYYAGLSFMALNIIFVKKFGPSIKEFLDKGCQQEEDHWEGARAENIKHFQDQIDFEKKEQWRSEGQLLIHDAQKENIALQLEAEYRARLAKVYSEVKRRLDYHVEIQAVERRVQQKHLVKWVTGKVLASITPDQDKATLDKCIADLGALAK